MFSIISRWFTQPSRPARGVPKRVQPILEALEVRVVPTAIRYIGPDNGEWDVASSWQGGVLPGPSDEAIIDTAGIHVQHTTGDDSIARLTLTGNPSLTTSLDLSGGSLTVGLAIAATNNFMFDLNGGTLTLTPGNSYSFNGSTFNYTDGTITQSEGTPTFTLTGSTLMIGAAGTSPATFTARGNNTLAGGPNAGQEVVVYSEYPITSQLTVGAGVTNAGIIRLETADSRFASTLAAPGGLVNTGTIRADGSANGARTVTGTLTNYGVIDVASGAALPLSGLYDAAGGTIQGNAYVSNAQVRVSASPPDGSSTAVPLHGNCTLLGDNPDRTTLDVYSEYPITSQLTVGAGATNSGIIRLETADSRFASTLAAPGGLVNTGTIRADGSANGARTVTGTLTNYGVIDVASGAALALSGLYDAAGGTIQGNAYVLDSQVRVSASPPDGSSTAVPLHGNCTLLGDNPAGTTLDVYSVYPYTSQLTVDAGATNSGTIRLQTDDSRFGETLVATGGLTNAVGGVIRLDGSSNGARLVRGTLTNFGTLSLANASVTFDSGSLTNQTGATLEGFGTVSLINGASFSNQGTVRVPSGQLDITGTFTNYDSTTHTLADGTYDITGILRFDNAAIVHNAATILLTGQQSVIRSVQTNADALANFALNSATGSFTVRGGRILTVPAGFHSDGIVNIGASSELRVNGALDNFDASSGTLTGGTWIIGGTLRFTGAAISTNAANLTLDRSETGAVALIVDQNGNDALANLQVNSAALSFVGGRDFTDAGYFYDGGTLTVGAGTTFTASHEYNEAGTAVIQAGGTLRVLAQLDNFDPTTGTLTGGTFRVAGRLQFAGAAIVINASDLTLDGPGFSVVNGSGGDALTGFVSNAAAGRFTVRNLPDYRITHAFTNLGTLTAGAGGLVTVTANLTQTGTLVVEAGATFVASFRLTDFDTTTGTLAGGTYQVAGTFQFAAANVRILAANLVLDGATALVRSASLPNSLVNLASVASGGSLTIQNGAALTTNTGFANAGSVALSGGSLTVSGDCTQSSGATLTLVNGALTAGTVVNAAGATLIGTGTLTANLSNAGLVQIDGGGVAGVLVVTGDFTQGPAGTLTIHLGLGMGSDFDQFQVGGMAGLDGALNALAPDSFAPNLGDAFPVVTATGGVNGQFATTMMPDLGAELYLDTVYDANDVTLQTKAH